MNYSAIIKALRAQMAQIDRAIASLESLPDGAGRHLAKFSQTLYRRVLRISWQYVKTTIQECPEVWVIGDGVRRALSDPLLDRSKWLYQPNGARTPGQRDEYVRQMGSLLAAIAQRCPQAE